jgi:hypothetical protein
MHTMLGLEPVGDNLVVDSVLPMGIGRVELLDIPGRWGRIDAFGRGMVDTRKKSLTHQELGILGEYKRLKTK